MLHPWVLCLRICGSQNFFFGEKLRHSVTALTMATRGQPDRVHSVPTIRRKTSGRSITQVIQMLSFSVVVSPVSVNVIVFLHLTSSEGSLSSSEGSSTPLLRCPALPADPRNSRGPCSVPTCRRQGHWCKSLTSRRQEVAVCPFPCLPPEGP